MISEVGYKDPQRSEQLAPSQWIAAISEDLDAGAWLVNTEARESGHSGICRPNGELRVGLIEDLLACDLDPARLLFEAPTTELQSYFVRRVGSGVTGEHPGDRGALGRDLLRLRGDTLTEFELCDDAFAEASLA